MSRKSLRFFAAVILYVICYSSCPRLLFECFQILSRSSLRLLLFQRNLESFTTRLPLDLSEHVARSFSSDLEEVRILLTHETRLAGARPRTYVISGDAHSGREDAILAMAELFNRRARLIPLKILLERYREQTYPTLENLIEQASHCEEKSFFICKDFDELDQAYESQWKQKFKNSPTISIWNAFERIGNMNQLVMTKNDRALYDLSTKSNEEIPLIYLFLTSDVGGSAENWKNWVHGPQPFTSSNFCALERDDNFILIEALYFENWEIRFSIDQFLSLLDQWEKLYEEKPDQIIITIDDQGKVTMEGRNMPVEKNES